jgi:altronate dehydratase large subunit
VAPVIKVTGNPKTYANLGDNMDINAGTILDGSESLNSVGRRIFDEIVAVANGRKTKAEALGFRDYVVFGRQRAAERLLGHC